MDIVPAPKNTVKDKDTHASPLLRPRASQIRLDLGNVQETQKNYGKLQSRATISTTPKGWSIILRQKHFN